MNSLLITTLVILCCFCGILLGAYIREKVPEHHLSSDSKDIVKLGTGLIATLTALTLGLLVSSANNEFRSFNDGLDAIGIEIIVMDRAMAHYGPETKMARETLRQLVIAVLLTNWPEDQAKIATKLTPTERANLPSKPQENPFLFTGSAALQNGMTLSDIQVMLFKLTPKDEEQHWHKSRALDISGKLAEDRWLLLEKAKSSLPIPFLVVLVIWLGILFSIFSVYAPRNKTVTTVLLLCAFSVSGAVFLILELNVPTEGILKASSNPIMQTLDQLGK